MILTGGTEIPVENPVPTPFFVLHKSHMDCFGIRPWPPWQEAANQPPVSYSGPNSEHSNIWWHVRHSLPTM